MVLAGCSLGSPSAVPTAAPGASPVPTATAAPAPSRSERPAPSERPLADLVGQKLVVRMAGTTPSQAILDRIRRGEVGGVVLFGPNIESPAQVLALTRQLQAVASAGGRPPLLIATDQEGGPVKRVPWAPPDLSPPAMGDLDSTATAEDEGVATGRALLAVGIEVDLAPVADVPASTASFLERQGRTWSANADATARLTAAFARGLERAGVLPTVKHFPGLGDATKDTDRNVVSIAASTAELEPGLEPFRAAIAEAIPLVMLSNAIYTAYDPLAAAGWSTAIVGSLLRDQLGFTGPTITDSLDGIDGNGIATAMAVPASSLAVRAATAGTDLILVAGSEATTASIFSALLAAAEDGTVPRAALEASYDRILALKASLPGAP